MSEYVNHELFVCECDDISHQCILSTWDFKDGDLPELQLSIKLNNYLPWYKRILVAFKYLFKLDNKDEFNVVLLNNENINKLQNSLIKFKKLQNKSITEDVEF